jgi:hypothetical protein
MTMCDQTNEENERRYDDHQLIALALKEIFTALDLVEPGNLGPGGQLEGNEARHELIIAGRTLASACVDRF